MSVSIEEVLNSAGYNFDDVDDCIWLLNQESDIEELLIKAEKCHDRYCEYQDEKETAEDDGDYNFPDFQEWMQLKGEQ